MNRFDYLRSRNRGTSNPCNLTRIRTNQRRRSSRICHGWQPLPCSWQVTG
jgi:hypothetical protein